MANFYEPECEVCGRTDVILYPGNDKNEFFYCKIHLPLDKSAPQLEEDNCNENNNHNQYPNQSNPNPLVCALRVCME